MIKFSAILLCLVMLFASAALLPHTADTVSFEEMYAVFKDYEDLNPEQIADILDQSVPMDGQIPYRGSMFVCGAGGNVLLRTIDDHFGIIEITWTGMSFPIRCIRGITPGMELDDVKQTLFPHGTPLWTELNAPDSLRNTYLLTSFGNLYTHPVRIELYFFFTADTLTAIRLSVCPQDTQQGGSL